MLIRGRPSCDRLINVLLVIPDKISTIKVIVCMLGIVDKSFEFILQ